MNNVHKGEIDMPKIIENIRENILENGKQMMLEGNYNDFSIRNLAKKCGLGLGTFYNYFLNKEELAYHIFKSDWDKTLIQVDELKCACLPFKKKLHIIYLSLESFLGQYMNIFKEMAGGDMKGCPHDYYKEIGIKLSELLEIEKKSGNINPEVEPSKLSYFLLLNMFDSIKKRHLTFDEMYGCINI